MIALLVAVAALAPSAASARAAGAAPAAASAPLPSFSFSVVPPISAPGGQPITGTLQLQQPVQISTVGGAAPELELAVELTGDPDRPIAFRADQLTNLVPGPRRVEITADLGPTAATFGYDAGDHDAPDTFAMNLGFVETTADVTDLSFLVESTGAPDDLPVIVDVLRRNGPGGADDLDITGRVHDSQAAFDLTLDLADGRVTYSGSARIEEVDIDAFRAAGIGGTPATTAVVHLEDVPTDVVFDFGSLTAGVGVAVGPGQQIGLAEVLLRDVAPASGELLAAGQQGLFVTQRPPVPQIGQPPLPARFVVHGRIAGLREARFGEATVANTQQNRTTRTVNVTTDPAVPEHPFVARFDRGPGNVLKGTVQGMPDDITLSAVTNRSPNGSHPVLSTTVDWTASETAPSLVIEGSATGFRNARLQAVPLPTETGVCVGFRPNACSNNHSLQDGQSFAITTSGPTDIDLFACIVGTGTCTEASGTATQYVDIDDLELTPPAGGQDTRLAFGIGGAKPLAEDLSIGVDTDDATVDMVGEARLPVDGSVRTVALDLDEVRAHNRLVFLNKVFLGLDVLSESGTMTCGPETSIGLENFLGIGQLRQELCTA